MTWTCLARIPIPIAASMPWSAEAGKNSLSAPKRKRPKRKMRIPEITTAARVNRYP
jgi:hypothetical protein